MMIKHDEVVTFYNKYMSNAHAKGICKEFQQITDDVFHCWIQSGKVPDRKEYSPSDIIEWLCRAQTKESVATSSGHKWSGRKARDGKQIWALYRRGKKINEIADIRGCSLSTVKRRLSDKGSIIGLIGKVRHRHILIQALHEDGWERQEIVEEVKVSDRTVRRYIK